MAGANSFLTLSGRHKAIKGGIVKENEATSMEEMFEDYATRVVLLESEIAHLRLVVERIGKTIRTSTIERLRTPMVFMWVVGALMAASLLLGIWVACR